MNKTDKATFLDSYLLYLLGAATHSIQSDFHQHLRSQMVRVRDWRVLCCLVDRPAGLMLTELAALTLFNHSHTTKIIDDLEAGGLVTRTVDESDKRRIIIKITESGRDVVCPLIQQATRHQEEVLSILSDEERITFIEILKKFIQS